MLRCWQGTSDERLVPNIFDYATSELSQDAMIAWLMACAKADDAALREVGQSFIRFLLETSCNGVESAVLDSDRKLQRYDGDGVVSEIEVKKQHQDVDVYCRARIDGRPIIVVIEDKIHATVGGNQLEKYRQVAQSDPTEAHYIKLIYLKTGMPFDYELLAVAKENYCHVGASHLEDFLNDKPAKTASSDLLDQFRAHVSDLASCQRQAYLDWNMELGQVQYRFAEALRARIEMANESGEVWQDTNKRGGGYWAQYRFDDHHLFWRMDTNRGHLRMMVEPKKVPPNVNVYRYREAFRKACGRKWEKTNFSPKSGETSLGAIPYPNGLKIGQQNVDAFLQSIAQVHERFLQEVAQIRADKPAS